MSATRTTLRALTVVAATVGLTFAGAGAAQAADVSPGVDGNTVTVRIDNPLPGETCIAVAMPPYAAVDLGGAAIGGDLMDIVRALGARDDVHALSLDLWPVYPPATLPGLPGTLVAHDVPSNFYVLATICSAGGQTTPHIEPIVVGDPLDAFAGSAQGSLGS